VPPGPVDRGKSTAADTIAGVLGGITPTQTLAHHGPIMGEGFCEQPVTGEERAIAMSAPIPLRILVTS
jgi:hypothetical protein